MKSFIWIGGITIVLIALMFWGVWGSPSNLPDFELGAVSPLDNVKGNASSTLVIVEYSDFQCPACRSYYPVMRQMMAEFGDRAVFVFRHFPLKEIHPNAEPAAWAAQAAAKQGKFWEMHDLLFEKQNEWAKVSNIVPVFESYAALLGLSAEQFKSDFNSKEVRDLVKAQSAHAIKSGLLGTPSFFLNGEQIQNPTSAEAFRAAINAALKK